MATEAHKFQVGAFVIGTTVIGIAIIIWLGASRFFEDTRHFVSYFSESVQGLEPGASVKYRGVPSGRVAAIKVAPDGELIEVRLDLDVEAAKVITKDPTLRATLELSGITGLRYVEIDRRAGPALHQSPTLTFDPPMEVLPSARSSFKAIQSALGDIYDQFMQMNLPAIAGDARSALQAANNVLRDDRVDTVLTNLEATTEASSKMVKNLEMMTNGVRLAPAIDNATEATAAAKDLFANLNSGPTSQQISDALEQINRVAQAAQQVILGVGSTIDRLDRTVDNLQSLTDEVRNQPSLLLFSAPPEQRRAVEGGQQ